MAEPPQAAVPTPDNLADLAPLQVPTYFGASFQTLVAGNDAMLIMASPRPAVSKSSGQPTNWAIQIPVCAWQMSIHSLKDLSIVVNDLVSKYEADKGIIQTDFMKTRDPAK